MLRMGAREERGPKVEATATANKRPLVAQIHCKFMALPQREPPEGTRRRLAARPPRDSGALRRVRLARGRRLVLLSGRGEQPHHRAAHRPDDVLMLGRESSGVPDAVAVVLAEAGRPTGALP